MGLDMYMRRVEKLNDKEVAFFKGIRTDDFDFYNAGVCYIPKLDFDDDAEMMSDLLPYVTEVPVIETLFNYEQCLKDHGIDLFDERVGSYSGPNGVGFSFQSGKRIDLTDKEYNLYLFEKEVPVCMWKMEEIDYWRKYHELIDFIESVHIKHKTNQYMLQKKKMPDEKTIRSWCIQNCGYYELNHDEKAEIKKFLMANGDEVRPYWDSKEPVFFHAWW